MVLQQWFDPRVSRMAERYASAGSDKSLSVFQTPDFTARGALDCRRSAVWAGNCRREFELADA